ncbi:MAG: hypothetical protein QM619_11095 [Micropruina sp.]|uniref:hypothetical protein n=1 Tax=Micropruina sp. TaxID=2737536 RepID=UPI0039E5CAC1
MKGQSWPSLTSRDSVSDDRAITATRIGAIANDDRFARRRHELGELARALEEGGRREAVWRGVDLLRVFSPESTIRVATEHRSSRALGVVAAIVVFCPVAWTWWSFGEAVREYEAILARPQSTSASFLQLWATGFGGGLSWWHQLSNVAIGSLVFIIGGILVVALNHWAVRSAERSAEIDYQRCAAELASALGLAQVTINSRNTEDVIQGREVLVEALDMLLLAHEETRTSTEALRSTAEMLQSTTTAMLAAFQAGVETSVTSLRASMDGTVKSLEASVDGVTTALRQSIKKTQGALDASITHTSDTLTVCADQVAQISAEMQKAAIDSTAAQRQLTTATVRLTSDLGKEVKDAASVIGQEVAALSQQTSSLADDSGEIGRNLARHTEAMQHQIGELTGIRSHLQRLIDPPDSSVKMAPPPRK